jgi:hypothetical protein
LILIAAMSASLVMATFIYGSQLIATWVVGWATPQSKKTVTLTVFFD